MSRICTLRHDQPPLIAHVIQRLAVGGLENGLVNLINHMPQARYRHAIICLTDFTNYADRVQRKDVQILALHQSNGRDLGIHRRFLKVIRSIRPAIVHTRNLPALEFQAIAALAGVYGRIHSEHGRDMYDLDGMNFKYNALRRLMRLFIHRYIVVSRNLSDWLVDTVHIPAERVHQIYNGVEMARFYPCTGLLSFPGPADIRSVETFVVGTVGRMEPVKDQITLVRAFLHLVAGDEDARKRLRLIVVGDGSLREKALQMLRESHADQLAWLPGERDDIPEIMRALDLFVLPSLREGISNTILEAMATGLPVVATNVGGNPELVDHNRTGTLVPSSDPIAMAGAIRSYLSDRNKSVTHGMAGRGRIETHFSMESMVGQYLEVYSRVA